MRGAEVTLIHGQTALPPVKFTTDVPVTTARQMYEAVTDRFDTTDVLIMAAAVADYRPATVANDKIKKKEGDLSIPVERTEDILGTIGPRKTHQFLCGFSMETRDLVENSSAKLAKKNLDMVVANNLKVAGAGFGVDTNVVTFITPDGTRELPLMSKADVADAISGRDPCGGGQSNTAGDFVVHISQNSQKKIMVLSENSALPVYFMLQKLYNKSVSLCLEGIGLRCSR